MKILHCCLAAFYIDDFSYQENILPKIHQKFGHEVQIVASREIYTNNLAKGFSVAGSYLTKENIPLTRLSYVSWLPLKIAEKLRIYRGLKKVLEEFKPDIIFSHDCQFLSIYTVAAYAKRNKVKILIDCHTDFLNSGRSWLSKEVLHRMLYRHCVQKILPHACKFFGTLPIRCDFLNEVYKVPKSKIELLPFGFDDTVVSISERDLIRNEIRKYYEIGTNDFVLISGGKIDSRKNIDKLLESFALISNSVRTRKVWLFLFGKPNTEMKAKIIKLVNQERLIYLEWLDSSEIYRYFFASDLAVFPGTHSVLWEEAAGLGLPLLLKRWKGIEHLDLGGNCVFLEVSSTDEITNSINDLLHDNRGFNHLKMAASKKGPDYFSYSVIAKKAINCNI
jgi:1,2-diacylglycerol 3-alpha-glucosyltransferase